MTAVTVLSIVLMRAIGKSSRCTISLFELYFQHHVLCRILTNGSKRKSDSVYTGEE